MAVLVATAARAGMSGDKLLQELRNLRDSLVRFGLADMEHDSLFRDPGKGHADLLKAILTQCSVGALSKDVGPVTAAVGSGRRHILRALLDAGAAVTTTPPRPALPITHFAMKTNRGKELDLVLHHAKARGIALDVDMADADGRPALALMARGNARATAVLLRHGSNVHRFWTERTVAVRARRQSQMLSQLAAQPSSEPCHSTRSSCCTTGWMPAALRRVQQAHLCWCKRS